MRFAGLVLALSLILAGPVLAAPGKQAKPAKPTVKQVSQKCTGCPGVQAESANKCSGCPEGHAEDPTSTSKDCAECPMAQASKSGAASSVGTVKVRCGEGKTRIINVAEYTKAGKYGDYKGKRYYFACPQCATWFKRDPAGYARQHTGFPIPKVATGSGRK